jgi:hypothetical protein
MKKSDTIKKYLDKFPNTPNQTLAKLIYKDNSLAFKDAETIRALIRYHRGSLGKSKGKETAYHRKSPHYDLPEGLKEDYKPFIIPNKFDKQLYLYDVHIPFHDLKAVMAAIKYGLDNKANCIILGGDFMDCYNVSRWEKDVNKRDLKYELDVTKDFLKKLRKIFPKAFFLWIEGNHEARWEAFLKNKAPELLGVEEFHLENILGLRELKIEYVKGKRIVKAGNLNVIHGHELARGIAPPVNPARGLYLRAKESTVCGHQHQTSEHTEPSLNGNIVTCWSVGCLSDLHPAYSPINKYNHGFGFNKVDKDGNFSFKNIRIINGKIV